jgi:tetratricopeptide (TPR) repeat protein
MQRVMGLIRDPQVPEEFKEKAFKRVEAELLKQIEEKPGDARTHVFISSFYRMTNNIEPAIEQLAIARALSPRKQLIIYEQGVAELQRKDYAKATEFFKEAYELGPQFTESRVFYAMSALYSGQYGLVDELIKTPEDKKAFAKNQYAIQAVYEAKRYPLLIEMFELQIEEKPNDPQLRTNLAFIFAEMGDTEGAIKVLQKAMADIPTFKAQGEGFIQELKDKAAAGA